MPVFSVNIEVLMHNADQASKAKKTLNLQSYEISRIKSRLFGITMIPVRLSLLLTAAQIREKARKMSALAEALKKAVEAYKQAENHILQFDGSKQNPAFDDEGAYGGDQGSPMNDEEAMIEIVRKYHPDWSTKQIREHLKNLNEEGCGYVAMVNTIFLEYKGREDDFEETFGFPMYDENGDLNYNALITDFYTAEDDPSSGGTTAGDREAAWEHYCQEHGINVDVHNVDVNAQNYSEIANDGEIVVGLRPNILYKRNSDGTYRLVDDRDAGHAMTVTGVTDDGRLIVSSWGEEYFLDPDLSVYDGFLEFQQVTYD